MISIHHNINYNILENIGVSKKNNIEIIFKYDFILNNKKKKIFLFMFSREIFN